jgi:hypothetical protein
MLTDNDKEWLKTVIYSEINNLAYISSIIILLLVTVLVLLFLK